MLKKVCSCVCRPSSLPSSTYGIALNKSYNQSALLFLNQQQERYVRAVANTEVIIKQDHRYFVEGEVLKVKSGYMRNFLYPNKIAVYATETNLQELNKSLTEEKKIQIQEKKRLLLKQREQERLAKRNHEEEEEEEETTEESSAAASETSEVQEK